MATSNSKPRANQPSIARLREALSYNPETGIFVWRNTCSHRTTNGALAGVWSKGYLLLAIDGYRTGAHRFALAMVNGEWPVGEVDHIDGDPSNNRYANLRAVNGRMNRQNVRRARAHNKIGVLGVTQIPSGKYRASIRSNGKSHYSRCVATIEEAQAIYLALKRALHEGNTL